MELTLPIDSLIVAGISMFLFNILLFWILQTASQSICSSTNLHILYDHQRPLTPQKSRLGKLFGSPVGNISIVRILSVLIIFYGIAVIPLDFSINGSTRIDFVPTRYRSVARSSAGYKPLDIDYENEYKKDDDGTLASRRLVAIADLHRCMFLNFSHHTYFAIAFRELELDKTLIPLREDVSGGECITKKNFKKENIMHQWDQTEYNGAQCNMTLTKFTLNKKKKSSPISATVDTSGVPDCDINFLTVKCFSSEQNDNCVAIAVKRDDPEVQFLISIPALKNPDQHERHQIRDLFKMRADYRDQFASNVAFLRAVGFPQGVHSSIYMAVTEIDYDVELIRTVRTNISSIDLLMSIPALAVIVVLLCLVSIFARFARVKYVIRKNRRDYNSFSSVADILEMANKQGVSQKKDESTERSKIILQKDRAVLSNGINSRINHEQINV